MEMRSLNSPLKTKAWWHKDAAEYKLKQSNYGFSQGNPGGMSLGFPDLAGCNLYLEMEVPVVNPADAGSGAGNATGGAEIELQFTVKGWNNLDQSLNSGWNTGMNNTRKAAELRLPRGQLLEATLAYGATVNGNTDGAVGKDGANAVSRGIDELKTLVGTDETKGYRSMVSLKPRMLCAEGPQAGKDYEVQVNTPAGKTASEGFFIFKVDEKGVAATDCTKLLLGMLLHPIDCGDIENGGRLCEWKNESGLIVIEEGIDVLFIVVISVASLLVLVGGIALAMSMGGGGAPAAAPAAAAPAAAPPVAAAPAAPAA